MWILTLLALHAAAPSAIEPTYQADAPSATDSSILADAPSATDSSILADAPSATDSSILADAPSATDVEFFERRVRPVLVEHCLACHDPAQGKIKGGLDLTHAAGWRTGGASGPALVPGDVAASLLAVAIGYEDEFVAMPPAGKLAAEDIEVLLEWIRRGAPDPRTNAPEVGAAEPPLRGLDLAAGREFWAYRPLASSEPPTTQELALTDAGVTAHWDAHPIDLFVLKGLHAAGLEPSPRADRRTLLRRVSFDLTGLPPTPEELVAFEADAAPDAWSRVVERLLASPHYGERWGRHWLDLARYSDSNGSDENLAFANAWRYRDYVVGAFNDDKPYDEFVREQLAGDLLPPTPDREIQFDRITATCFLTLGPKMLAEQDKEKLRMDVVDEQVDLVGRVFMGQTLGCARCHDHKFDPIPTRDYYALAGIFRSTSIFENYDHVSRWRERALETEAEQAARTAWQKSHEAARAERTALNEQGVAALRAGLAADFARYLAAGQRARNTARFVQAERAPRTNLRADSERWGDPRRTVLHTHEAGLQFAEWDVADAFPGTYRLRARYGAGDARPLRLLVNGELVDGAAFGEITGGFEVGHLAWRDVATITLHAGDNVLRVERTGPVPHLDVLVLVPTELATWPLLDLDGYHEGGRARDLAPELVLAFADELAWRADRGDSLFRVWDAFATTRPESWEQVHADLVRRVLEGEDLGPTPFRALVHGGAPASLADLAARHQAAAVAVDAVVGALTEVEAERARSHSDTGRVLTLLAGDRSPAMLAGTLSEASFPASTRAALRAVDARLAELEQRQPPEPAYTMAAVDEPAPIEVPVHVRGSHLKLEGDPVPRGFLSVLAEVAPWADLPVDRSGRLALAEWLTDPANPLTARVFVNRVWQHHFGAGLVRSPSNFGVRGAVPTHPELLDWLAVQFIEKGWSVKALHRAVLTSEAWMQSVRQDAVAAERDPNNELLWRQNRRRVEAEVIRDTLLAVAGQLDPALGGSLLGTSNRGYVTNDQSRDGADYSAPRRSLYLPIIRNAMYPFFGVFDYGDPSVHIEERPTTTVATQALFLMNSPLAVESAAALARRIGVEAGVEPEARVRRLYELAYGRAAEAEEIRDALEYVAASAREARGTEVAWSRLCQAVLASNELVFVD